MTLSERDGYASISKKYTYTHPLKCSPHSAGKEAPGGKVLIYT